MSDIKVRIIDRTPSSALKSIIQSTTTVDIGENTTDTYTVVLDADPTGDVVIAMTSSDNRTVTTARNNMSNSNSFVVHIRVIHSSNRNRLWTAPVASGKGE
jgi:hypothetical protein